MRPQVVTFDCAATLLKVDWRMGEFARDCANHAGLDLDESASLLYTSLYKLRHNEYLEVNKTKDHEACQKFWRDLGHAWLRELNLPEIWQPKIEASADILGFGPESRLFQVYEDVVPCLTRLRELGIRLAVISNWDYSLHRALRGAGLYDWFEVVVASLEEGIEKPDPRIFHMTLERMSVEPSQAAHVGDDALDDLKGARDAGLRAVLIDRARKASPTPPYISSLDQLPEALGWTA